MLLHFGPRAYLFSPEEGRAKFFRPETIVASFLHHMALLFKVLSNHSLKTTVLVLHCRILKPVNVRHVIDLLQKYL